MWALTLRSEHVHRRQWVHACVALRDLTLSQLMRAERSEGISIGCETRKGGCLGPDLAQREVSRLFCPMLSSGSLQLVLHGPCCQIRGKGLLYQQCKTYLDNIDIDCLGSVWCPSPSSVCCFTPSQRFLHTPTPPSTPPAISSTKRTGVRTIWVTKEQKQHLHICRMTLIKCFSQKYPVWLLDVPFIVL